MSFFNQLDQNTKKNPNKIAVEFIDEPTVQISYASLYGRINQAEGYLISLGIKSGDRVGIQLEKSPEFIYIYLAVIRMGAIALPLNPAYPMEELRYFLEDSECKLFFVGSEHKEEYNDLVSELENLEECVFINLTDTHDFTTNIKQFSSKNGPNMWNDDNRTSVIIYTSGTTGRPKGAQITQGNLDANLAALFEAWGWEENDVLFHVLPIFHVHGLFVALKGALYAGATAILTRKFDADRTLDSLVSYKCSVLMGVPTIHRRLLASPKADKVDLSHMRLITSGSDRLPDETFSKYEKIFGHTLLERYGMTETGMNLSNPYKGERRIGSVGFPLPGVQARIVDLGSGTELGDDEIGEVQLLGSNVFKGYWKQPLKTKEAFTSDGWFHTGDLGFRSPDGYFTLKGRSKDLIISGGMNIYPPEVERVLATHPAVLACAVIGCQDPEWGESIVAVVVIDTETTQDDLQLFCKNKLASYKIPKEIYFQDALPRNALGKVQKEKLRQFLCR